MRKFECKQCEPAIPCVIEWGGSTAPMRCPFDGIKVDWQEVKAEPKRPKLTAEELAKRGIEWPEWATCAVVNGVKHAYFHEIYPHSGDNTWCTFDDCHVRAIPGEWDASDWQNSLIERPAVVKENLTTELPEWCRVGKWVYHPRLNQRGQIVDFRDGGKKVFIKYPDHSPCSIPYISEVKPLTLIPWDDSTLPSLPFCVKFKKGGKNFRTTVVSASISGVWLGGVTNAISYDELSNECEMLDGSPCGVLEVVENEQ